LANYTTRDVHQSQHFLSSQTKQLDVLVNYHKYVNSDKLDTRQTKLIYHYFENLLYSGDARIGQFIAEISVSSCCRYFVFN